MQRVSLCVLVYLIWEERNKRIFDDKCASPALFFRKFQIIFDMILHFHEKDHSLIQVPWWFLQWMSPLPGWAVCGCLMLRVLSLERRIYWPGMYLWLLVDLVIWRVWLVFGCLLFQSYGFSVILPSCCEIGVLLLNSVLGELQLHYQAGFYFFYMVHARGYVPALITLSFILDGLACSDWPCFVLWLCGRNSFACSCMWLWFLGDPLAGCCWLRFLLFGCALDNCLLCMASIVSAGLGMYYSIVAAVAVSSFSGLQPAFVIIGLMVL